jgi:hypothetical protein
MGTAVAEEEGGLTGRGHESARAGKHKRATVLMGRSHWAKR